MAVTERIDVRTGRNRAGAARGRIRSRCPLSWAEPPDAGLIWA